MYEYQGTSHGERGHKNTKVTFRPMASLARFSQRLIRLRRRTDPSEALWRTSADAGEAKSL
jgi:hypothetical protein